MLQRIREGVRATDFTWLLLEFGIVIAGVLFTRILLSPTAFVWLMVFWGGVLSGACARALWRAYSGCRAKGRRPYVMTGWRLPRFWYRCYKPKGHHLPHYDSRGPGASALWGFFDDSHTKQTTHPAHAKEHQ